MLGQIQTVSSAKARKLLLTSCLDSGSGNEYQQWHNVLPNWIEIVVMHPPGRGVRMSDEPMSDMKTYVSNIATNCMFLCNLVCITFLNPANQCLLPLETSRTVCMAIPWVAGLGLSLSMS